MNTKYQAQITKIGESAIAETQHVLAAFPTAEPVEAEFGVWLIPVDSTVEQTLAEDGFARFSTPYLDVEIEMP